MIDDHHSDRYLTLDNEGKIHAGHQTGWDIFHRDGSPRVSLETEGTQPERHFTNGYSSHFPLDLLWADTEHYEQNSPGIMARAADLDRRSYHSWIDKAWWINVLRVPVCASYMAACAKVQPKSILELGTGGDSAHSTGMFLYWLSQLSWGKLVSVDRHPLSTVWPRYRDEFHNWNFIQGDSVSVARSIFQNRFASWAVPTWFDMIFIDSSHLYPETMAELNQCSVMTDAILMDDTTYPDVEKALAEWLPQNPDWISVNLAPSVALLERKPKLPA